MLRSGNYTCECLETLFALFSSSPKHQTEKPHQKEKRWAPSPVFSCPYRMEHAKSCSNITCPIRSSPPTSPSKKTCEDNGSKKKKKTSPSHSSLPSPPQFFRQDPLFLDKVSAKLFVDSHHDYTKFVRVPVENHSARLVIQTNWNRISRLMHCLSPFSKTSLEWERFWNMWVHAIRTKSRLGRIGKGKTMIRYYCKDFVAKYDRAVFDLNVEFEMQVLQDQTRQEILAFRQRQNQRYLEAKKRDEREQRKRQEVELQQKRNQEQEQENERRNREMHQFELEERRQKDIAERKKRVKQLPSVWFLANQQLLRDDIFATSHELYFLDFIPDQKFPLYFFGSATSPFGHTDDRRLERSMDEPKPCLILSQPTHDLLAYSSSSVEFEPMGDL